MNRNPSVIQRVKAHGLRFPWNEDKSKFEIVLHPSSSMWNNFLFLVLNANLPTGKMLCAISILTKGHKQLIYPLSTRFNFPNSKHPMVVPNRHQLDINTCDNY